MGFWDWLFGPKLANGDGAVAANPAAAPAATAVPSATATPTGPAPANEAENLKRWRASGQPQKWVEAHQGRWNHDDWVSLLTTLERSTYWPMKPEAVGQTLEELKTAAVKK